MLGSFVNKNKGTTRFIIIALISAILLFDFIVLIGSYGDSNSYNAAITFNYVAYAAILGVLLYCMIANKSDTARLLGVLYIAFYVIESMLSIGSPFAAFYKGNHGTFIAAAAFEILANISILGILVFGIIEYLNGKTFNLVVEILVLAFLGFCFMTFVMQMAAYAVAKYDWTAFMASFTGFILMPALATFGYLYLHGKDEAPKDEAMEDMGPQA